MGSDSSPQQLFQGVLHAAERYDPLFEFVAIAAPAIIATLEPMAKKVPCKAKLHFVPASELITMEDDPISAVRRKKDSSLMVGMRLLKSGDVDALITAGNTGALITAGKVMLPLLPTVRRPALIALLPTKKNTLAIIDAGGNVKNSSNSLIQDAYMGAAYQRCHAGIEVPVVGLLNIGVEANKGPQLLQEAYRDLKAHSERSDLPSKRFHFAGNIEARDLFNGKIDVLVTDGFTGNVLLKAVEGTALFLLNSISAQRQEHTSLEALQSRFNYIEYPGALVCGVDGVLIKCHGNATEESIFNTICGAISLLEKQLIQQMRTDLLLSNSKHR